MKGLSKAAMIIAKILEIGHWVGAGLMAAVLVLSVFAKELALKMIADPTGSDSIYGFQFSLTWNGSEELSIPAMIVMAIAGVILLSLMAMVFRNIYLIIKTSRGETKFSKGSTPFQPDNIRMVREIGIFMIAVSVVDLIMGLIGQVVIGPEFTEGGVDLSGVVMGLVMLWLTSVFAYGAELQSESDGLI